MKSILSLLLVFFSVHGAELEVREIYFQPEKDAIEFPSVATGMQKKVQCSPVVLARGTDILKIGSGEVHASEQNLRFLKIEFTEKADSRIYTLSQKEVPWGFIQLAFIIDGEVRFAPNMVGPTHISETKFLGPWTSQELKELESKLNETIVREQVAAGNDR